MARVLVAAAALVANADALRAPVRMSAAAPYRATERTARASGFHAALAHHLALLCRGRRQHARPRPGRRYTLYDLPVSNNGARVRQLLYYKGVGPEDVAIVSPMDLGGLRSDERGAASRATLRRRRARLRGRRRGVAAAPRLPGCVRETDPSGGGE